MEGAIALKSLMDLNSVLMDISKSQAVPERQSYTTSIKRVDQEGTVWGHITGSDIEETPIEGITYAVKAGDMVNVVIKDGVAYTDISSGSPVVTADYLDAVVKAISTGDSDSLVEYSGNAKFDNISASVGDFTELNGVKGVIKQLEFEDGRGKRLTVEKFEAVRAYISSLIVDELTAGILRAEKATLASLLADQATISQLAAQKLTFEDLLGGEAFISSLIADDANVSTLIADKADINFENVQAANIAEAWVNTLMARSAWFTEEILTTGDMTTTGRLTGVLVDGDTARFANIYADALKILGEDGLYHKLNFMDLDEEQSQALAEKYGEDLDGGLHGSHIIAETITADQLDVTNIRAALLRAVTMSVGGENGAHIDMSANTMYFKDGSDRATMSIVTDETGFSKISAAALSAESLTLKKWKWNPMASGDMSLKWVG